ncbi:elongation factor P hydroxylase [Thalassotalea litorea]|uniref:Elongation factor P hydroxylase n=1 Tax=Thalassotalea litorea TaxID=2020715 RepID=A0A5R9IJW4_9GAMM|nr:elongation factor P hydroxylase [Thalassotalea litorea]TLU61602.1 elongation factor P hydroxylase [Thalassotalea litorea]
MNHHINDLIALFDSEFSISENTRLIRGGDEPIYLPADASRPYHQIIFAHGFYASALHEISHWCIAGKERRLLEDFGYWYAPDGRDANQQAAFEKVEVKPQAIEWAFCIAAGFQFNVSVDNLSGVDVDRDAFKQRVFEQVRHYLAVGYPSRAQKFIAALAKFYDRDEKLKIEQFALNSNKSTVVVDDYQPLSATAADSDALGLESPCNV